MNIQMSFFNGEYLTNKKKMGALCSHLFLVVSGSVHSCCTPHQYGKFVKFSVCFTE